MLKDRLELQPYTPFKGPNVIVAEDTFPHTPLNRGGFKGIVPVLITPDSLPNQRVSPRNIQRTPITMRSRFAQSVGAEIWNRRGIFPDKEGGHQFNLDDPVVIEMELRTHATRPLFIPKGTGLFRFYNLHLQNQIKGIELMGMINNRQIRVQETPEHDIWMWAFKDRISAENITGVYIKVNADNRKWLPPDEKPIIIPETTTDYRNFIDGILEPVPLDGKNRLWIGETPKFTLPDGINAILAPNTFRPKQNGVLETGYHIKSRLIDEKSNWGIRVEIISPSDGHEEWVLFYFFRDPSKLPE